jgi:D-alanyl-D-alanine carboxypeptidase/D-alanyl-D-alanine-endopeptidase (penicillin-binding protein 4)
MYDYMKKIMISVAFVFATSYSHGQNTATNLGNAVSAFEADSQLRSAVFSLYVIEANSGAVVYDKNSNIGLAPASTLKIITASTAYELLGKGFRYSTELGYLGKITGGRLNGSFYLKGSGDPTFGSWRWKQTTEEELLHRMVMAVRGTGINRFNSLVVYNDGWETETIPDGWIWQDIGNYYGAGANQLIWRENQYDMILKSGKDIGDPVTIVQIKPKLYPYTFKSYAVAAAKGTGDNSYIYLPVGSLQGSLRGTIPINESQFVISGAMPSGIKQLTFTLLDSLSRLHIEPKKKDALIAGSPFQTFYPGRSNVIFKAESPALDSIIYWFLKKSINLYGEALVKTFACQKKKTASTENGVQLVKDLWKEKGIDVTELNIVDGSGLSPLNRVTTHAQVTILKYARGQSWFDGFYYALPESNGMKMKSGSINWVKSFCGYHTSKEGTEYIFSFIVNNYNGSSSSIIKKMYAVLDVLK